MLRFLLVAIEAGWETVLFLWVLMVAVSSPTSQAARRLPTMHPDVSKMLIIAASCKPVLGTIKLGLYIVLHSYIVIKLKICGAFLFLARVSRKKGREVCGCVRPFHLEWDI
jgi:hypothetical protein